MYLAVERISASDDDCIVNGSPVTINRKKMVCRHVDQSNLTFLSAGLGKWEVPTLRLNLR